MAVYVDKILKNCHTCKQKQVTNAPPIFIYDIDSYRQCRTCTNKLTEKFRKNPESVKKQGINSVE